MGKVGGNRLCKLHSVEFGTAELLPGQSVRVGRHRENDIHMPDTMVSRFHARFTWDLEMERPAVFDNGSQNGTTVNGERVRTALPLRDDARVAIGPFIIKVELQGCADVPALLKDTGDMVTLFSDEGPDVAGFATTADAVLDLLQRLERERRTGTLTLALPVGKAIITYCLGRVMYAEHEAGLGLRTLEHILRSPSAEYQFSRELEPRENPLNLWVSDFLRARDLDPAHATEKYVPTQRQPKPSS